MDFTFTEEQQMIREMVRNFTSKELKPRAAEIDQKKEIPRDIFKKAAELGLMGMCFPEKYGGAGAGEIGYCIMLEELGRGDASFVASIAAHQSIGAMSIYLDGTEEQKRKYLVPLARGEKIAAFCLTEPEAGSDAANIQTVAELDGDHYILNGQKIFITNGGIADILTVFAVTNKTLRIMGGVSAFIVESSFPGFKVGKIEDKMGIRGSNTAQLFFENCRVPKENLLGRKGYGFLTAMKTLDYGRLSLGAACLGAGKELIDLSTRYAKQRVQFGEPISSKQAIQWMLAEMACDVYAMENMVYRTAWMADKGMKFGREAAIVKLFCSEALDRIVDKAVQIHGGMGYMSEYGIERMYRDARINRIFEGTSEIQKMVIALDIIKRDGY